jgi:Uma2 family endonuclease
MTAEEFYSLPDDGTRHELVCGVLVAEPLSGARHGRVTHALAELIGVHVRRRRLGIVFAADTGFLLSRSPDTVRGPDISFVSRARFEAAGDRIGPFPGAPDLAVEVLSPSNTEPAIRAKVAEYLSAGTKLVWVVDSAQERIVVYRTLLAPNTLALADELEGEDVVPGFRVRVSEILEV